MKKYIFLWNWYIFWNYMITYIISTEVIMGTNILKSLNYFTKGPNERSSGDVLVGTLFSFYDKHCSQSVSPYRLQITCFYIMWFGRTLLSHWSMILSRMKYPIWYGPYEMCHIWLGFAREKFPIFRYLPVWIVFLWKVTCLSVSAIQHVVTLCGLNYLFYLTIIIFFFIFEKSKIIFFFQ